MIKQNLKFLPILLAISSASSFANDINIDTIKNKSDINFHDFRNTITDIDIQNKNAFVNLEIQDLVITDIATSFESISNSVKLIKSSDELHTYLKTLGKVKTTSTFNFASVPTNSDNMFENSSASRHLIKNDKDVKKKDDKSLDYNNGEDSNSYMFNLSLKRMFGERFEISVNGVFDTDYVVAGESIKNENNLERSQLHRVFKQTSAININEYSILSYDVKPTGAGNNVRESRFLIVRVTGTDLKRE